MGVGFRIDSWNAAALSPTGIKKTSYSDPRSELPGDNNTYTIDHRL
jgi:hypothetical protein